MFWNVIDEHRKKVLEKVIKTISLNNFYMAGGTAIALQLNTRESYDFDFFAQEKYDINLLISELQQCGSLNVGYAQGCTIHCVLDDVKFSFIYFPNTLINELVKTEEIDKLYLASIDDISLMKIVAISQRGTKKDFFDLYCICKETDISIKEIMKKLDKKYGENIVNYYHIIQSLTYFKDAEDEILPTVFMKYDWDTIKDFYTKQQMLIYID